MKEEKFLHSRSFGISEGNIIGIKKQTNTEYTPNCNCRKENFPSERL